MTTIFLFLFTLLGLPELQAQEEKVSTISFGNVNIGESRIPLKEDFFEIKIDSSKVDVKAELIKGSIQWVRVQGILLTPRARLGITIKKDPKTLHIRHNEKSIILQEKEHEAYVEFYVSLFQPEEIEVYDQVQKIATINVFTKTKITDAGTHLIDYSCSPYNIKITGMDGEYLSIGCRMTRLGDFGSELPMLEILLTSANFQLADKSSPPYIAVFLSNNPINMSLINHETKTEKEMTISATIPQRLHRLKTAFGFGPYGFTFKQNSVEEIKDKVSTALMLYGRFDFTEEASLRFFDALVFRDESVFNNFGLYYAYDLTTIFDRRLQITALLGLQTVQYRFNSDFPSVSETIFPQGLEIIYKHAFGFENHSLVLGGFVDPANSANYQNFWIRYGKKVFWELNFISWQNADRQKASMWGISLGVPFFSLF
ncbi:MAG: hypothetical protein JNM93_08420 [Bacteriovoracaceae bacterium]|nr:hypothetical protein [Bacteriovoracaceae bacterium]